MKQIIPKFQLDMTKIPAELNNCVRAEVQKILNRNGFSYSLDICLKKDFIILGYCNESDVNWDNAPFQENIFKVYDVLQDWDIWTQLKVKEEFTPIMISGATINSDFVWINNVMYSFQFIKDIYGAVLKAEKWKEKNKRI